MDANEELTHAYFDRLDGGDKDYGNNFGRFMRRNWRWRQARTLGEQRARARAAWAAEHGPDPLGWPALHPAAVVWAESEAFGVCLGCASLSRPSRNPSLAADDAREHGCTNDDVLVWSECNVPIGEDDILFVLHPDPERDEIDAWWGVCRACGTGSVASGSDIKRGEVHNDIMMARWSAAHVCADSPDYFWLSEYGDVNAYYGLDLDAL